MNQLDMFGDPDPVATEDAPTPSARTALALLTETIGRQPEKLRPSSAPPVPMPTGKAELDEWTRITQRSYLLYLVGAIARNRYRESNIANVRYILKKLNGLGGEW